MSNEPEINLGTFVNKNGKMNPILIIDLGCPCSNPECDKTVPVEFVANIAFDDMAPTQAFMGALVEFFASLAQPGRVEVTEAKKKAKPIYHNPTGVIQ